MNSCILYCPHLNRDIRSLLAQVPDPQIVIGQKTPNGCDGCLDLHKQAVRHAMFRDWPSVFVMEDDCEFTSHFNWDKWTYDAEWAQERNYDVLVGGSTRTYDEKIVRDGLIEVSAFHSAHCVVYFRSGYEKILQAVQPFDVSLGRNTGCRIVLTHPFVAVQKASFSGILQKDVNYVPLYAAHERALAQLLNLLLVILFSWSVGYVN